MSFFASPLGGAVLNLGQNLLGGLFGGRSARKQAEREHIANQNRFYYLREAAEKGGFNPLTALESGYQSPLSGGGVPPLASAQLLTSSLQGFSDVLTGKAAQEQARTKLDLDLAKLALETGKANLAQLSRPSAVAAMPGGRSLGANTVKAPPGAATPVVVPISKEAATVFGSESAPEGVTPVTIFGKTLQPYGGNSDAEVGEARYAELGSELLGAMNVGTDYVNTFYPKEWGALKSVYDRARPVILPFSRLRMPLRQPDPESGSWGAGVADRDYPAAWSALAN